MKYAAQRLEEVISDTTNCDTSTFEKQGFNNDSPEDLYDSKLVAIANKPMHEPHNPLCPNISINILHAVLYTFPKVLTRRICLTIKNCFNQ